jgi:hypothetical protein
MVEPPSSRTLFFLREVELHEQSLAKAVSSHLVFPGSSRRALVG